MNEDECMKLDVVEEVECRIWRIFVCREREK